MDLEGFLDKWTRSEGGAERANYQMFLTELCDVLEVPRPDPAVSDRAKNDYVFERAVRRRESETLNSSLRIDLYKKGAFILEAKQSKKRGEIEQITLPGFEPVQLGRRSVAKNWDVKMKEALSQAEGYVFRLDKDHPAPPFLMVCDVGHCLELYADFSGTGRAYTKFPDRQTYRIYLEELRDPAIRARLAAVWTDPLSLNPARETARVTRKIADRLAEVSKALEDKRHKPEEVAHFLMRCIFTMFAEDVDLLPKGKFTEMLEGCVNAPQSFKNLILDLWSKLDEPDHEKRFYSLFGQHLKYFNGNLFKDAKAFALDREEIGELLAAAKADWRQVDPAIFGSLLEHALDPAERRKLGAHYTPRAYVQRLVEVTVMEPLREDWRNVRTKMEAAVEAGEPSQAKAFARDFHKKLCQTRVLDPACGTGNFLYVALELMKALEGDVLEELASLGETETLGLDTVDPHQFLGLELNPRAAAIAELVVWIGYLQQHYRTRSTHPAEPILRAFNNINGGKKDGFDAVLAWDWQAPEPYTNPRIPDWPTAEFIVGNPPFIGNKRMNSQLGEIYVSKLRKTWGLEFGSADFVIYWWAKCAELLKRSEINRFGLVTTNSLTMAFNRKIVEKYLNDTPRISLIYAIPDHPWSEGDGNAAVRIAMTVAARGKLLGTIQTVKNSKQGFPDSDQLNEPQAGKISAFLTLGARLDDAEPLMANAGMSFMGVIPVSLGFVLNDSQRKLFNLEIGKLPEFVKIYIGGKDLTDNRPYKLIIDFFGLSESEARNANPEIFQHVLQNVKPFRDKVSRKNHRENWWIFGEARPGMRIALRNMSRYIGTTETSKHRWFVFIDKKVLPDQKIRIIASNDSLMLSFLSSNIHVIWSNAIGGRVGKGNDPVYNNSLCFDPFPFPEPSESQKLRLRALGEELDATRKRVLADHSDLTLTGLYNVLEKLKSGTDLTPQDEDVKHRGLVVILKDLHDQIDRATADAYGWPHDLSDQEILARLVALNAERAREEAAGRVRWLRPDYQIPRFAKGAKVDTAELDLGISDAETAAGLPVFPKDRYEQPLAVKALLARAEAPLDAQALSRMFKGPSKARAQRIVSVLQVLAKYGDITDLGDGRYAALRAA